MSKKFNEPFYPERRMMLIGDTEMEVALQGATKLEVFALEFAKSLTVEYVKKPTPAVIEMVNSQAIKMAKDLLTQLSLNK